MSATVVPTTAPQAPSGGTSARSSTRLIASVIAATCNRWPACPIWLSAIDGSGASADSTIIGPIATSNSDSPRYCAPIAPNTSTDSTDRTATAPSAIVRRNASHWQ